MNKIDVAKTVSTKQWEKFLDRFSTINYRRHISVKVVDSEGDQELVNNAPLLAMIYDRHNNGDNLAIEVDKDETIYGYSIDTPTQIFTGENSNGETMAIWIAEATGRKTLVKLS
jgi:hypothetical protein